MASVLHLVAGKVRDNLALDLTLARASELPPAERLRLWGFKYAAIARDQRSMPFLGHTLHYDNRLAPALMPSYLEEISRLDRVVSFATASTILDVGANVGQFGATLAWRFPHLKLWSFEPNPDAYALLRRNAEQTPGWTTLPFGIAEADREAEFWYVPGKSGQGSVHKENATTGLLQTSARQIPVHLRRLTPALLAEHGIPASVDLLKVDVEGAEAEALQGLTAVDWRYLAIETSTSSRSGANLEAVIALVEQGWGKTPRVAWAAPERPGATTRDVVLAR